MNYINTNKRYRIMFITHLSSRYFFNPALNFSSVKKCCIIRITQAAKKLQDFHRLNYFCVFKNMDKRVFIIF